MVRPSSLSKAGLQARSHGRPAYKSRQLGTAETNPVRRELQNSGGRPETGTHQVQEAQIGRGRPGTDTRMTCTD